MPSAGGWELGAPSKKKATGTCRMFEICCSRLAPMRLVPFSYFCTCWNVRPRASPSFSWLIDNIIRRMRTRLPTCLSIGFGVFLAIIIIRSSITPVYGVMAIDSNSVTIDSNSYAIHIPMVRHQVMRKCDKLPFLRAASAQVARDSCDEGSGDSAHNLYLWVLDGPPPHPYSGMPDRKRRRTTRKSATATMTKAGA